MVVVEVPVGSRSKYEYEPELGVIMLDRVLPGNVRYPADYGFVPSTEGADGELLDAMVAAYEPVFPGCVLKARIAGALEMSEGGETEYTVFAVPEGDARFDDIKILEYMPGQNVREIEQFFTAFKRLEGDENAEDQGWHGIEETHEIICNSARQPRPTIAPAGPRSRLAHPRLQLVRLRAVLGLGVLILGGALLLLGTLGGASVDGHRQAEQQHQ